MAEIKVPYWVNNQTRLNATNMNSLSNAINDIATELYGENGDSGLVRTVDTHDMYFVGEANVTNSGIFKQIGQLGRVLLTPNFCNGNDKVQAYSYDDIRNYEITLPNVERFNWWNVGPNKEVESPDTTFRLSLGVSGNDGTPRSLIGNNDSFAKIFADTAVSTFERVEKMGATYRPRGIFFNPSYNSFNSDGSVKTQVIEAVDTDTLKVTTGIFSVGNDDDIAGLQVNKRFSESTWIGYNKDVLINKGVVYIGAEGVNSVATITPTSGIAIRGQLSLTGAASLQSTLEVIGKTELKDELSVANNTSLGAQLSVTGALTVNDGATITGNSTFNNNIAVNGTSTFNDNVTITANGLYTTGDSIFNNKLNVKEATTLESTLAVSSTSTFGDKVTVSKGGLQVSGKTELKNSLEVTNGATLNSTLLVKGNTTLQGILVANTADVQKTDGTYYQGTNASSVVVLGNTDDTNVNTLRGESKARKDADEQLAKDYAQADTDLQTAIVGEDTDTISSNTLKGVINYANAQISAINTALSFLADKDVIATAPSFTFNSARTNVGSVEVGTKITPSYEITFNPGAYEYTPTATGCTATDYKVTFNSTELTTSSGSFTEVHVTDSTSLVLTAKCTHSDGNVPKNNLGLDYAEGKIVSDTKTISRTLSGFRQAFAGGLTSKQDTLDSATIRTLIGKGSGKKSFDIAITGTDVRVVVAFPSSWGSLTKALDVNDSSKNIVTSFGTAQIVKVSGATAGQDEIDYKVYIMDFASAYGGSGNTYNITIS